MAIISLNVDQLKTVNSEVQTLDDSLIKNYLPELEQEIEAIKNNVQGDELHQILNSISSQFGSVKTTLTTALPKLEGFLEEQLQTYTVTEEQLKEDLSAVLNKMIAFAEQNGTTVDFNGNGGSTPSTSAPSSTPETTGVPSSTPSTAAPSTSAPTTSSPSSNGSDSGKDYADNNPIADAASGAVKGAAIGAVVGSIVPVIGTATGAVVGAKIGAAATVVDDVAKGIVSGVKTVGKKAWGAVTGFCKGLFS